PPPPAPSTCWPANRARSWPDSCWSRADAVVTMRRLFLLLVVLASTACTRPSPDAAQRYEFWRQSPDAHGLIDYQRTLADAGVGDVVPMQALLRSSRRWQACEASEFLLPPRDRATAIVPTLRV